jgi:predicted DNA-binding transcriptional regulator YafY
MEDITQLLWHAAQQRQVCRITLAGEPLTRVVHPYGICRTARHHIVLVCWQAMGFTKAGAEPGYRQLELRRITEVEILDTRFSIDPGFNPADAQYREWVFHV